MEDYKEEEFTYSNSPKRQICLLALQMSYKVQDEDEQVQEPEFTLSSVYSSAYVLPLEALTVWQ